MRQTRETVLDCMHIQGINGIAVQRAITAGWDSIKIKKKKEETNKSPETSLGKEGANDVGHGYGWRKLI